MVSVRDSENGFCKQYLTAAVGNYNVYLIIHFLSKKKKKKKGIEKNWANSYMFCSLWQQTGKNPFLIDLPG